MSGKLTRLGSEPLTAAMTVIEIRPPSWGWKVFEAPGVEPVFPEKRQEINYAEKLRKFSFRRDSHFGFRFVNALTTIGLLLYTRRYDCQISCAHLCNRSCQCLLCTSSMTHPERIARCIAFTGKTSHAQKSRSDGLA